MGVRVKLILAMLLVFGSLGVVIISLVQIRIGRSYEAIEREQAQADMRRLVGTLEAAVQQIDDSVIEWAEWTELYDFMERPTAAFRAAYFSPDSVNQTRFYWLGVYERSGHLLASVGRIPSTGQLLDLPELAEPGNPLARALAAPMARGASHCGLLRQSDKIYGMCRRPITDSRGELPPRGVVVVLREISRAFMHDVARQTNLAAELRLFTGENADRVLPSQAALDLAASRGEGPPHLHVEHARYLFDWPLQDVLGRPVAVLSMDWARTISAQGREVLWSSVLIFIVILLLGALLMLWVVDRLVVTRLGRLAFTLQAICSSRDWGMRTREVGGDEIARLSSLANDLLALIQGQMDDLARASLTDPLTGLPNRRCFDAQFARLMAQHRRNGLPLTLVAIDVDCFKLYNDGYGHVAGDEALRTVADCLRYCALRAVDLPCRVGGEEFLLLLPECALGNALAVVERFRSALRERAIPHEFSDAGPWLTASIGLAQMQAEEEAEDFCRRADHAMYQAKAQGRDRVVVE